MAKKPHKLGPNSVHEAFSQIRMLLMAIARNNPREIDTVGDVHGLLEQLEEVCLSGLSARGGHGRGEGKPGGDSKAPSKRRYCRTVGMKGVCLAEVWAGTHQPFLIPLKAYQECAKVLARADGPLRFEDILVGLRQQVRRASEHWVRACLRFWQFTTPPLLKYVRRHYAPCSPATFEKDVMKAWKKLEERPVQ